MEAIIKENKKLMTSLKFRLACDFLKKFVLEQNKIDNSKFSKLTDHFMLYLTFLSIPVPFSANALPHTPEHPNSKKCHPHHRGQQS